jgi:hypothetical protein
VAPKFPTLIGYEGVGLIEARGPDVQGFAVGERVCVLPNFRLGEYGIYGERAIVPARSLLSPPPGLTTVEAASIWMQYFTALAIIEIARAAIGDYVIVRAALAALALRRFSWPIGRRRADRRCADEREGTGAQQQAPSMIPRMRPTWSRRFGGSPAERVRASFSIQWAVRISKNSRWQPRRKASSLSTVA